MVWYVYLFLSIYLLLNNVKIIWIIIIINLIIVFIIWYFILNLNSLSSS